MNTNHSSLAPAVAAQAERRWRRAAAVLFFIYLAVLTWIILFKMAFSPEQLPRLRSLNLIPYGQSVIVNGQLDPSELFQNIAAFLPFGVYLGILKPRWPVWKCLLAGTLLSLLYESLQYLLAVGASDITDLINNSLGALAGILIYRLAARFFPAARVSRVLTILAAAGTALVLALLTILLLANR